MTANALQEARERCRAAGMDDYIAKSRQPAKLTDPWQLDQTEGPP
jgi:CheY-like chemotaxis protein